MKKHLKIFGVLSMSAALLVGCSSSDSTANGAASEAYPEDQISLVVPFAAGGASDMVSRSIAAEMEKELEVPVVIVNKVGGSGAVGMTDVRSSEPNGYTLGYVPVEMVMLESLGLSDITPDDFDFISRLMTVPAAITVPADAPYNTIQEFIDYATENPGEIQIGNSGVGSIWHLAAAALAQETDAEFTYIPFDGGAPAVTALTGGHIQAVSVSPSEVKAGVDGENLKILAVMGDERDPAFPDVPTLKEEGIDLSLAGWGGFVAPKGTPEEIVSALDESIENAMETEEFKKLVNDRLLTPAYLSSTEFETFANEQYEFFSELIPSIELN